MVLLYLQPLTQVGDYLGGEPPPASLLVDSVPPYVTNNARSFLATPTEPLDSNGYANTNLLARSTTNNRPEFPAQKICFMPWSLALPKAATAGQASWLLAGSALVSSACTHTITRTP